MSRVLGGHLAVVAVYCVLAVVFTFPLAANLTTHIPGHPGDNFVYLWGAWWLEHAAADPDHSALYCPLLLAPHGVSLALHDAVVVNAVIGAVARPIAGLVGGYNLAYLLALVLSGYGTFLLARKVSASAAAGLLAGVL